ncbi:hypothetical protein H072_8496 [Dactylellina haptotyla CBS 200.50]|uniref:Calcineurin-like phosphoesterase domain-containing protein n=1 Tax=Dactylellina haptotyla (strain CBS 200.50) TaxID=1284197 RepID=S8A9N0_DACHA|nr:hypothetical protein H072_8496 [Dactylellina haptotyla CBS 200.50]
MKYEKLPTEDYDDDAQELSVELATNVDSDEERDLELDLDESGGSSAAATSSVLDDDSIAPGDSKKDKSTRQRGNKSKNDRSTRRKRSKWTRHMYAFVFLLFTTIVVFTFLPSAVRKLIVWRHNKLHGGSCKDKTGGHNSSLSEVKKESKDKMNLFTSSRVSYNPSSPYIQLSTLPQEYIPKPTGTHKHLIFVGDVHGMLPEFQDLMRKLGSKGLLDNSHVVLAGDMISKGPESIALLDTLIGLNVSCVRGNHEDEVMKIYWKLRRGLITEDGVDVEPVKDGKEKVITKKYDESDEKKSDDKDEEHDEKKKKNKDKKNKDKKNKKHKNKKNKHRKNKYKHSDMLLAKSLKPHHAAFIDSCPLILKLDGVSNLGDVAVVHAGMVPGVDLERQKPSVLMNVRTFVKKVPTPGRKGLHWSKMWNDFMLGKAKEGEKGLTVVYGHDARRGLELKKYTKGLDTNCVRGGRLTAFVVTGGKTGGTSVVSVKCRKYL